MTTIAVLGARGRISHEVARAFHAAGYTVIAITRGKPADDLPEGVEHRSADASNRAGLIEATRGCDLIFNGLNPLYTEWKDKVMPMAENVVAAAKAHGAVQLFVGTVYNYGREIPALADETTAFHRSTRKAGIRIDMEACFERAAREEGVKTIVLRAGDFYGTRLTGSWFDLVIASKLAKGVFTYPGPMTLKHAWAYVPDLARAFVSLAAHRDELGMFETFTFAGDTLTGEELMAHAEAAMGRKLKRAGLPWVMIRAGGLFNAMWREIAEMSYLWFAPHALCGRKLAERVGDLEQAGPQTAIREAILDLGIPHTAGRGKAA